MPWSSGGLVDFALTEEMYLGRILVHARHRNTVMHTQAPSFSFLIARSTAGWKMPLPRKVSMTCPLRKNAENTLAGSNQHLRGLEDERDSRICEHYVGGPKSPPRHARIEVVPKRQDAPSKGVVHTSIHQSQFNSVGKISHVEIWFDTKLQLQRHRHDSVICRQLTCHHTATQTPLVALEGAIEMLRAIHGDGRTADLEERFAEQPYCPNCSLRK